MKALIIAAGRGSRLNQLAKETPKALVPLLGLPLIERVILTTKQAGINEYVVVVGYLGEKIIATLGHGERFGVKINYIENEEWHKGNGLSVLKAKDLLNGNFVLLMSDHIFDGRILKGLVASSIEKSVVLAVDRSQPAAGDTKVLEKDGKIVAIGKDIEKSNCIDTGLFLCSPRIFSHIEDTVKADKTELSDGIARAAQNEDAEVFDIMKIDPYMPSMRKEMTPFWIDIDTKDDITRAEKVLIEGACKGRNDLLATYVNKPIENFIVKHVAPSSITPNQITIITNLIAYLSSFLFLKGYLLYASLITFVVSFMDGVDGKLSRVKLASSHIGKMEHAFDFLFEHSWYVALAIYLSNTFGAMPILLSTFILFFDGFSNYCGSAFGKAIKSRPLQDYGRIEQLFRKFDGRKNSYIIFILIGVLLNAPFYSLAVITFWSCISALFYCVRTMKHLRAVDRKQYKAEPFDSKCHLHDVQPGYIEAVAESGEETPD